LARIEEKDISTDWKRETMCGNGNGEWNKKDLCGCSHGREEHATWMVIDPR